MMSGNILIFFVGKSIYFYLVADIEKIFNVLWCFTWSCGELNTL